MSTKFNDATPDVPIDMNDTPKTVEGLLQELDEKIQHVLSQLKVLFRKGDRTNMIQQAAHAHDRIEVAIQVAAILLKQKGELSIRDIKAIPFLSNSQEVTRVIEYLVSHFHGEVYQKKVSSRPIARWEKFIRIRSER